MQTPIKPYDTFTSTSAFHFIRTETDNSLRKEFVRAEEESDIKGFKEKRSIVEANMSAGPIDPDARSRRNNMAYPKGTFLIRLSDLRSSESNNAIWMVDNYQLIQKCVLDRTDTSGVRFYAKTERYSGWLADEPWLYFPLTKIEIVKDPTNSQPLIALLSTPTREELQHHENHCSSMKALHY